MRLRGQGITRFQDLKIATIEPNGLLGYELKEDAKPVTVGELKKILNSYGLQQQDSNQKSTESKNQDNQQDIFTEINSSKDQGHADYLQ
ncbi:YetF domain-containing protein [Mesobacillus campisalis]|uniref:YetF domain-containing protein n=1 Tax=Mesobacillus campisalis TaxID=1408103 RepID=UPI003B98760F